MSDQRPTRPGGPNQGPPRPQAGQPGARPQAGQPGTRPQAVQPGARPQPGPPGARPQPGPPSVRSLPGPRPPLGPPSTASGFRPTLPQDAGRPVMPTPQGPNVPTAASGAIPKTRPAPQQPQSQPGAVMHRQPVGRAQEVQSVTSKMGGLSIAGVTTHSGSSGSSRSKLAGRARNAMRVTKPTQIASKKGQLQKGEITITVLTNYFTTITRPEWKFLLLSVDFNPPVDDTRLRKALLSSIRQELPDYIYDGTNIYMIQSPVPAGETLEKTVRGNDGTHYKISIKLVGELFPHQEGYQQFLNIILRSMMDKMNLVEIRREHYDPNAKVVLDAQRVEIWPGYKTSIRQHEKDILVMVDISHKILKIDTVLDEMRRLRSTNRNYQDEVARFLIGKIIMTKHNYKTYRIAEVLFNENPQSQFRRKDGTQISFIDYFKTRYNLNIRDPNQPLLLTARTKAMERLGQSAPIQVPELCSLCNITPEEKADFRFFAPIQEKVRSDPPNRIQRLKNFRQSAAAPDPRAQLEKWALGLSKELTEIQARVLPLQEISSGSGKLTYKLENAEWQSVFKRKMLAPPDSLKQWSVVFVQKDRAEVNAFVSELVNCARNMGFEMGQATPVPIENSTQGKYVSAIRDRAQKGDRMIMSVVPNNRGDAYPTIKKLCYVNLPKELGVPVPSQVVTMQLLNKFKTKGFGAVATKVAAQMAAKLGGALWSVANPLPGGMVVGYDAYHDSTSKGRSVGAVVCSMNPHLTRFQSFCSIHSGFEELASDFKSHIRTALDHYREINGQLPGKVLIYRDGVGIGQEEQVLDLEVEPIRQMLEKISPSIGMSFVIVTKRISTKFFQKNSNGQHSNPSPGTVVDDVVTLPLRYDFFLVSQSVRQGTVNPTGYNVVHDTSRLPPEYLQLFTYKMTHLYYNWPGQVRVPMVCQYAHKLAYLVGEHLHVSPDARMTELYYL